MVKLLETLQALGQVLRVHSLVENVVIFFAETLRAIGVPSSAFLHLVAGNEGEEKEMRWKKGRGGERGERGGRAGRGGRGEGEEEEGKERKRNRRG